MELAYLGDKTRLRWKLSVENAEVGCPRLGKDDIPRLQEAFPSGPLRTN